jgi:uncharacterized protein YcbK (DUF882 family)
VGLCAPEDATNDDANVAASETAEAASDDVASLLPRELAGWSKHLKPLVVRNVNTGAEATLRLYTDDGDIDPEAEATMTRVLSSDGEPHALSRRLLQLVVKAAYHLQATEIGAISAYRPEERAPKPGQKRSRHATGEALDFRVPGTTAAKLAALLRTYARAGVGIYTHPKTQYVHLDVRDESFHWIDGSPPRVHWRERGLWDAGRAKRDAAWVPELDLPLDTE